jgi:hypothetical protein
VAALLAVFSLPASAQEALSIHNAQLSVHVRAQDGSYEIRLQGSERPALVARVGAQVDHRWLVSSEYPRHQAAASSFNSPLGPGHQLAVTFTGLATKPDLVCILRLYDERPFGEVQVKVRNGAPGGVSVQAIRLVDAIGEPRVDLGGPEAADRVMSDSFSEDPTMKIADLADAPSGMHRGVRSQLVYNQESKQSLLLAALTSERFLTILRLHVEKPAAGSVRIGSYVVDSTGTTEIQKERDLEDAPPEQQIELSLEVPPGNELASERLVFAAGSDYFSELNAYAEAVRILHHARVGGKNLMGWWSWTAFYSGITEGVALTNARWLAEHLKALGYEFFHVDEGYQYARGEYLTPNATQFPHGMRSLGQEVCRLGLKLGIWTAPFEVSGRSWVYEHHKDWLVHDAHGKPIQIGFVGRSTTDPLFVLDTTHPGAQEYLRQTYRTLTREWGVRYIKLDFMDSSAIEGYYHRPGTTALEAQRTGLEVIRKAVGEDVLLDKDGSPMLNPVGLVDEGRISVDTGHSFAASKEAAPNIAARYYMNGNFYRNDPDAFTVSQQLIPQQEWHQARVPVSLDEAQVSIVLAAVSGGMFEIGDDLPTLAADPDRLALVENPELLCMARLTRAAVPLDLMTFRPEDEMPSIFFLQEDRRQAMLAVFNWTEQPRSHRFTLADLKLPGDHAFKVTDALDPDRAVDFNGEKLVLDNQPSHSVRLIKIVDGSVPAAAPSVTIQVPAAAEAGESLKLSATADPGGVPALSYQWDFGDGTSENGAVVSHTYTRAGEYTVELKAEGVDGIGAEKKSAISVRGWVKTHFNLQQNRRYKEIDSRE